MKEKLINHKMIKIQVKFSFEKCVSNSWEFNKSNLEFI